MARMIVNAGEYPDLACPAVAHQGIEEGDPEDTVNHLRQGDKGRHKDGFQDHSMNLEVTTVHAIRWASAWTPPFSGKGPASYWKITTSSPDTPGASSPPPECSPRNSHS
jgi:hypothetical protein